jgi:hypothetical protein
VQDGCRCGRRGGRHAEAQGLPEACASVGVGAPPHCAWHVHTARVQVEKVATDDSVWTSAIQIERLLRPGAKYRNLNPYEAWGAGPRALSLSLSHTHTHTETRWCPPSAPSPWLDKTTAVLAVLQVLQVPWDCEDVVIKKQYRKVGLPAQGPSHTPHLSFPTPHLSSFPTPHLSLSHTHTRTHAHAHRLSCSLARSLRGPWV